MLAISGTAILQEVLQFDIRNDFTGSLGEGDRSASGGKNVEIQEFQLVTDGSAGAIWDIPQY